MTSAVVEMPLASTSEPQTEEATNAPGTEASEDKGAIDVCTETAKNEPRNKNLTESTRLRENVANENSTSDNSKEHSSQKDSRFHYHDKRKTDYSKNIKSSYDDLPTTDDPIAIRKQVEFYFSDSNLGSDKFLYTQVGGPENNAVPIETIHSFKRMRRFQPLSAIVAALKESSLLDVVDGDSAIRRKNSLPENFKNKSHDDVRQVVEDAAMARSIYVKGFGEEKPSTQFDIEAFFSNYGVTNQVRLRRDLTKAFKGSVFVEFDCEEAQKKFLELDPEPTYHGQQLIIKSKKQYCDEKVADINAGKVRRNDAFGKGGKGRGGFRDRRNGKDDGRDWRERRDEDRRNGFRDDRNRRGRGGFGSRGRGGGGRDVERIREGKDKDGASALSNASAGASAVVVEDTAKRAEGDTSNNELSKKRDREDEGVLEEHGSKKKQKEDSSAVPIES